MHNFTAFLLDTAQLNPFVVVIGMQSDFLFKLNLSARQQIFSGSCFAFWNCPCAVVFADEKWSARMRKKNFQFVSPAPEHEQTGTDSASRWCRASGHNLFYTAWPCGDRCHVLFPAPNMKRISENYVAHEVMIGTIADV